MNSGEETGEQAKPVAEAAGGQGNSGPRRRGGRGGRGRGRGRGFGGRRPGESQERPQDGPAAGETRQAESHAAPKHASLQDVVKQVERIRGDLGRVLEDMNHVLHLLEQVERENTAADHEIRQLRDSLQSLRGHGNPAARFSRRPEPQPASTKSEGPEPGNEAAEEWD